MGTVNLQTNANSDLVAHLLQEGKVGTFTSLLTTKKGKVKKGVRYGDDTVKVTIFTGFKYPALVQRSLDLLKDVDLDALVAKCGGTFTKDDAKLAAAELKASFERTLGTPEDSLSTTAHVYVPLTVKQVSFDDEGNPCFVNGKVVEKEVPVRGSRVYVCVKDTGRKCHCRACTEDPKAPLAGTIYLQGLKIHQEVLKAAENGPAPKPNSRPKTLAKDAIRYLLPVARYVSYPLEPGTDFVLKVGGTARLRADGQSYDVEEAA